jgi:hypothetical protein
LAKQIDIVVSYNAQHHDVLFHALFDLGTPLAPMIAPNEGDLIGIEVEVSAAEKTGTTNVEQNHAAGIALNVIAVLPKAVRKTIVGLRTTLPVGLHARVVVIDALQLLAKLQEQNV